MWYNQPAKLSNSVEKKRKIRAIMPFKVTKDGINRKPVYDFLLVINTNWHPISYRFGFLTTYCSNFGHFACLSHPLVFMLSVHLELIGKRVVDFLLVLTELFARCLTYGWGTTSENRSKIGAFKRVGKRQIFTWKGLLAPIIFARIDRPINALQLCRWHFSHKETL